jgi:hypothetical protein
VDKGDAVGTVFLSSQRTRFSELATCSGLAPFWTAGLLAVADLQARGHVMATAGDGINDAPALARADAGPATETDTDVAMESAAVTPVKGYLRGTVLARRLSRATMSNLRQNLFVALVHSALGVRHRERLALEADSRLNPSHAFAWGPNCLICIGRSSDLGHFVPRFLPESVRHGPCVTSAGKDRKTRWQEVRMSCAGWTGAGALMVLTLPVALVNSPTALSNDSASD